MRHGQNHIAPYFLGVVALQCPDRLVLSILQVQELSMRPSCRHVVAVE